MKYITEFYGDIAKKTISSDVINKLKEVVRRQKKASIFHRDFYSREYILKYWKSDSDTGFYALRNRNFRSHTFICAKAERLAEFEERIATSRGYHNERKPTKKQRETAQCFIMAWDNLGGYGDNAEAVSVEVYADMSKDELIPIAIPDNLEEYEKEVDAIKFREQLDKELERQEKEDARRSKTMTITVGMWEDMMKRIEELEESI